MQIHELPAIGRALTSTDYLVVDDGTTTYRTPGNAVGVIDEMTEAEAEAGTVTDPRVITPETFNEAVTALATSIAQTLVDAAVADLTYKAGDVVSIATSGSMQFAGKWASTTSLRFAIPMGKPINATSVTVSGDIGITSAGKWQTTSISAASSTIFGIRGDCVTVQMDFASNQSGATANNAAVVQPNGNFTITFS